MVKEFCEYCNEEITNAEYVLNELSSNGYDEKNFCNLDCFLKYILKKFKRQIKKLK